MQDFKERVKNWLQEIGEDRFWLSKKIDIPKRTIDNWLSPSGDFPQKGKLLIENLISEKANISKIKITQSLNIEFDEETYNNIEKRALELGITVREWIKYVIKYISEHPEMKNVLMGVSQVGYERGVKSTENNHVAQNDPTIIRGLDRAEETPA